MNVSGQQHSHQGSKPPCSRSHSSGSTLDNHTAIRSSVVPTRRFRIATSTGCCLDGIAAGMPPFSFSLASSHLAALPLLRSVILPYFALHSFTLPGRVEGILNTFFEATLSRACRHSRDHPVPAQPRVLYLRPLHLMFNPLQQPGLGGHRLQPQRRPTLMYAAIAETLPPHVASDAKGTRALSRHA
jgi:hypothetical protein